MRNTFKIAISLPKEDYYRIENIRKKLGFARSVIIDKAIRFWLGSIEQDELIKRYQKGYRKKPESLGEIRAMEMASSEAFKEEDLE